MDQLGYGEGKVETMTPDDIKNWLSCNDKGEVVLDKEAMSEWIEEFCLRYKTVGRNVILRLIMET